MCTVPELIELDLKGVDTVAIDLETYDPGLKKHGSGAIRGVYTRARVGEHTGDENDDLP